MDPVAGRVVLVTGAARGIGAATARALSRRGARLSLVGLEPELLAEVGGRLGEGTIWREADVTDQGALNAATEATARRLGGIDAVVANAGVANYGTVLTADPDAFARTVDVNLVGAYRTIAAAVPHLVRRRGYALIVASLASFAPLPGAAGYSASKAGAEALAGALRGELAHHGVAVGSAHPSWIDTDMVRDAERALPTLRALRDQLPWPVRSTTSAEACGEALADAVARRARRVYVPRSIALVHALRPVLNSALADRVVRWRAARLVPQLEAEIAALRVGGVEEPIRAIP
ncbi:MAG: SDR family oxidoreductase [Actinomycetota bacterium]